MINNIPKFVDNLTGLNGTWYSSPLDVRQAAFIGYAVRTTGTMAGTWSVQYSNDYTPNVDYAKPGVDASNNDTKWDTYALTTSPPAASGSAQTFGIILDNYEYAYVRLKFSYTSGTGTAFVAAQMKG